MKLAAITTKIPAGKAGIVATLHLMRRLVQENKKALIIRTTALFIVQDLPQKDYVGEVSEIFQYVRDGIRYVKDVAGVETLQYPQITLQLQQGDCDDKSTLLAALLESIGHKTRFKAIGFSPGKFSHVFVQVLLGGEWVSLDPTMDHPIGWQPPNTRSQLFVKN